MFEHHVEFISLVQATTLQAAAKLSTSALEKVQEILQKFGSEGWELVSLVPMATTSSPQATLIVAAFKRPKG